MVQRLGFQIYGGDRTAGRRTMDVSIAYTPLSSYPILTRKVSVLGQTTFILIFPFSPDYPAIHARSFSEVEANSRVHLFGRVGGNEGNTLLDVLLEVDESGVNELLLVGVELAERVDLLNTLGAELDLGAEELNALVLVERRLDESGLLDTLLALDGAEDGVSHAGTSHGHGESGRASTVLGLDNLVTTELDTLDELSVGGEVGVVGLREERDDGDTRVTTNDGDVLILGVGALELGNESGSTDNIEGGDTEEGLGVVDTGSLEDLLDDGDGGVDGVGDDQELGLGGSLGSGLGEITDDGGVGVEEIVTGHAGLAGNTSGDEDNLSTLESLLEASGVRLIALDGGLGVDVGDISSNT
jgi:hypothetical protein